MLPSMPLLMTSMKELADDSADSCDESQLHKQSEGCNEKIDPNTEKSSMLLETNKIQKCNVGKIIGKEDADKAGGKLRTPDKRILSEPTSAQKKRKKTLHKKTLLALTPDTGESLELSAQNFAEAYFQKAKTLLTEEKWTEFVKELVDFEAKADKEPTELYKKMEVLLSPHEELVDEFLACLLPHQALQVNRLIPYLMLVKMKEFFRKMSILLQKKQSQQVFSALESLTASANVTLADVKTALLPLLKSSTLLTNLFLELLPGERPPDKLMTDFEQMDMKDDSQFETIVVPDYPDPYGNDNCICPCHALQENRHCVSCGIKYVNGRVYLQYGKVLRPAKVTFIGNKHLDLKKWEEEKNQSRRRPVPKSLLSPICRPGSDDDGGVKKSPRTPRIRTPRPKACKKVIAGNKDEGVLDGIFPLVGTKPTTVNDNLPEKPIVDCNMKPDPMEELEFDEAIVENDCNTEEDEEEEINKGLQSENESSLEGEDIGKELELANDCSFEDEDMDDIENDLSFEGLELNVINNLEGSPTKEGSISKKINSCMDSNHINTSKTDQNIENFPKQENTIEYIHEYRETLNLTVDELNICNRLGKVVEAQSSSGKSDETIAIQTDCQIKVEQENVTDVVIKVENEELEIYDVHTSSGCSPKVEDVSVEISKLDERGDSSAKEWTREEDKIILQTFQQENELEQTFETASLQLPNRSKEEIQERFEVLLKLLKEMISDNSTTK